MVFYLVLGILLSKNLVFALLHTVWKVSKYRVFLVRIFPHSDWIRRDTKYLSAFSRNAEKYGPEKTPYLGTFHAVSVLHRALFIMHCSYLILLNIMKRLSKTFRLLIFLSSQLEIFRKSESFLNQFFTIPGKRYTSVPLWTH